MFCRDCLIARCIPGGEPTKSRVECTIDYEYYQAGDRCRFERDIEKYERRIAQLKENISERDSEMASKQKQTKGKM